MTSESTILSLSLYLHLKSCLKFIYTLSTSLVVVVDVVIIVIVVVVDVVVVRSFVVPIHIDLAESSGSRVV